MGKLFVISGASGVGKSTVLKKVMAARKDLQFSVSATTRPPRPGEEEGVHYYFVSKETFEQMLKDDAFVEYSAHAANYYGTPKAEREKKLKLGSVILDIEPNGAFQVSEKRDDVILIFIMPPSMEELAKHHTVIPIFSQAAASTDTRFGSAREHLQRAEAICGCAPILTVAQAEPIGPKKLLDALVIAPCTGNTLAKLAHSIADGPVTMAAKSHLRNGRPVLIAISTNDGLSAAAENIGKLLNRKNIYFVPFRQDDPFGKPYSLIAKFDQLPPALRAATEGYQVQPLLYCN